MLGKALEKTDKHKTRSRHQRTGLLVEETEWMVVKVAPRAEQKRAEGKESNREKTARVDRRPPQVLVGLELGFGGKLGFG